MDDIFLTSTHLKYLFYFSLEVCPGSNFRTCKPGCRAWLGGMGRGGVEVGACESLLESKKNALKDATFWHLIHCVKTDILYHFCIHLFMIIIKIILLKIVEKALPLKNMLKRSNGRSITVRRLVYLESRVQIAFSVNLEGDVPQTSKIH